MPENDHATEQDRNNQQRASGNGGVNALEGAVGAATTFNDFATTVQAVATRVEEIKGEIEVSRNEALVAIQMETIIASEKVRQQRDIAVKAINAARDAAISAIRSARPSGDPVGPEDTVAALSSSKPAPSNSGGPTPTWD